jgi:hypothetical protein
MLFLLAGIHALAAFEILEGALALLPSFDVVRLVLGGMMVGGLMRLGFAGKSGRRGSERDSDGGYSYQKF